MSLFTAEQLDLSRLPPYSLVAVDYEDERAALIAGMQARLRARGIPYDVGGIESDPYVALAEDLAFRKTLDLQALNDAGRRLSLTYGRGAALDHMAATYYADLGLRRLTLVADPHPFAEAPEDWEDDGRFQTRILLAGQARSPGTLAGYELAALTAAPHLTDALALNHASGLVRAGQILVVLLGRNPDPDPLTAKPDEEEPAQIELARAALRDRRVVLGSDEVLVRPAARTRVSRGLILGIRPGPDPALVTTEARARYAAYVLGRRRIGKLLAESGEKAAAFVSGVEYVRPAPGQAGDVDPGIDGVVEVSDLSLLTERAGG